MRYVPTTITSILFLFATGCAADLTDDGDFETEDIGHVSLAHQEGQPNFPYVDVDGNGTFDKGVDHQLTKADQTTPYSIVVPAKAHRFVLSDWSLDVGGDVTIAAGTVCDAPHANANDTGEVADECAITAAGNIRMASFRDVTNLPIRLEAGGDLSIEHAAFTSRAGQGEFDPNRATIELTSGGNMTLLGADIEAHTRANSMVALAAGGDINLRGSYVTSRAQHSDARIEVSADGRVALMAANLSSESRDNSSSRVIVDAGDNVDANGSRLSARGNKTSSSVVIATGGDEISLRRAKLRHATSLFLNTCNGYEDGCNGEAVTINLDALGHHYRHPMSLCVDGHHAKDAAEDPAYHIAASNKTFALPCERSRQLQELR